MRQIYLIISACLILVDFSFEKSVQLQNTETKYITSRYNGVSYKLYISLPEGYFDKNNFSYVSND